MPGIVIDTDGAGFGLTGLTDGVPFRLTSKVKVPYQVSWTSASHHNAWLVYDRNGNGRIDDMTELFGNLTPQPIPPAGQYTNGSLALAQYDLHENGGNADGIIDMHDAIYGRLRLWQDNNHNGIAESTELHALADRGLIAIPLKYTLSRRVDANGNKFRYRGKTIWQVGASMKERTAWDVYLQDQAILPSN